MLDTPVTPYSRRKLTGLFMAGLLVFALPGCRATRRQSGGPPQVAIRYPCRHVNPLDLLSIRCKECEVDLGEALREVDREVWTGDTAFRRGDSATAMEHYTTASEILKWLPDVYTTVLKAEVSEKMKSVRSGRAGKDMPPCPGCIGSAPCFGN